MKVLDQSLAAAITLARIGDGRAVTRLVRDVHTQGTSTISALASLLQRNALSVTTEDLRLIAGLDSAFQVSTYRSYNNCGIECEELRKEKVDCAYIRQLARQELIRRGLEA